ncbi:hypothetical protein Glove_168g150 [Diversispora epigaea]|uniref:Uncharacterized protein n=1 Tax=Diversispora epigaea TaxID=1348612 RepID=A0A397IT63_9GLOM|nr:hypothetical protein Glove_168g150 [Diversispora epigaea]
MSQESRTLRIHIKRRFELSSFVDISSLKEKYNIRLPRSYKEQTSALQTVHFSEELESTIPETVDELKTENRKLKEEIAELKRQNSQIEIDFEEKLEKSQENINQMKEEIDFLANINQQFESSETSKKSVDISSLKEKYNIRLPRSYKEQTSALQTVHFSEELESTIPETVDELKTENRKLKEEIAELKRQNSQMEIDFEEKLEKSQENINQMKEEIDFLANINQQFGAENDQLIKNLDRFRKYRIPESISVRSSPGDSGTESEIIPSKRPKGRKLKSKKIAKTNKGKRVFGNDSEEEDTESDDEKNEKGARNEMKTIIKTINSEFSLNYDQTFTSANNCEICRKLIPELQKSLAPKFRPSVTQLTKWLNSIHKSRRATARMRNSGKLPKDLRRVHANNRQNDKKLRRIKAAKELFRKNDPNITDYNKESLLRMLADRAFHSPEMSDTDEEDRSKTVLKHLLRNVLDPKSASSTTAQLQRKRNYSDEIQRYDFPPPAKAPNWACNEQEDVVYDTEFVQTEGEDEPSFASTSSSKISAEQ